MYAQVANSLILKIKNIGTFSKTFSYFFLLLKINVPAKSISHMKQLRITDKFDWTGKTEGI